MNTAIRIFALVCVSLLAACDKPEQEAAVTEAQPAASGQILRADQITSIDDDGNVAPFGMASRQPVEIQAPEAEGEAAVTDLEASVDGALFGVHCGACHGVDAKGVEGLGLNLVDSELVDASSADDLAAFLKAGRMVDSPDNVTGVPMPSFAWMGEDDLNSITAYLKTL